MLYLDERQCVAQVLVEAVTFLGSLQLILSLRGHCLQIFPACTANKQGWEVVEYKYFVTVLKYLFLVSVLHYLLF